MEILDSIWFHQMGNPKVIGIVKIRNDHGEEKSYVGEADGIDQRLDEIHIAETGARFIKEAIWQY